MNHGLTGGYPQITLNEAEVEQIARTVHEANKGYCESLGDLSQRGWDHAPDWQKASARNGVVAIFEGKALTAEQSHNSWMEEKLRAGWRYAPEKNEYVKEHPCLLPYTSLSPEQQFKDHLFRAVVGAFLQPKTDKHFRKQEMDIAKKLAAMEQKEKDIAGGRHG